jgi:spectinomycin phosphotransferase
MLDDPRFDEDELAAALRSAWGVVASAFTFVPGYDMQAATYVVETGVDRLFLKVYLRTPPDAPLAVPSALLEAGVPNVLAPIRTRMSGLSHAIGDGRSLVLYPFIAGRNAMVAGMTADQWRVFGSTLRAVHDSEIADRFAGRLPVESFGLVAAAAVRSAVERAHGPVRESAAAERLAAFLRDRSERIGAMVERAKGLGARLATRRFEQVLCHADIHAANVLVADDGRIFLVDWDGPMLAPRERDLLFVIGSRIARDVEPHEEAWFFEGYGEVPVDPEAMVYYRYERILEDIGEIGRSVFDDGVSSEASRAKEVALAETFFGPGGILETVERV